MEQTVQDAVELEYAYPDMNYWKQKLDGEAVLSSFPYDKTRRKVSDGKERIRRTLPEPLSGKLYEMTNHSHLGVFMILLSGVKFLLSRYNRLEDLVIGAPPLAPESGFIPSRPLLLRSRLHPEMTLREWLGAVKGTVTEAFRHQNVPFHIMAEQVQLVFPHNDKPLIPTVVMFDPIQSAAALENVETHLIFRFECLQDRLALVLGYERDLYDSETMEYLIDSLFLYYESLLRDSTRALQDVDILSDQSCQRILHEFNAPAVALDAGEAAIPELFEQRVRAHPERTALIFEGQRMTYRQLNEEANTLARYLAHSLRLKKEEAVMVCMQRSPYTYVAILGILKAGGTFIPVDPAVPGERVQSIVEEAGVRLAVTLSPWAQVLKGLQESGPYLMDIVCLDGEEVGAFAGAADLPDCSNSQLAYIIFTSGSTGKPKGVEIEQKSLVQFLHAIDEVISPASPKAVLNAASISFDLFISESFYALFKGMEVVIANEGEHMDAAELARLLEDHGVELLMMTPSRLQLLLHHPAGRKALAGVKMILVGGQELKLTFLEELRGSTGASIVNVYGPTEATCLTTASLLGESADITIGRPLQNYSCYILDDRHRLQVIGGIGELVIGGGGLARCYMNNPALTREKFVTDTEHTNQRWYRTGDLARWLPDGEIQYLGRMDNQVKIRGYRIETSDIEAAILTHPQVNEAVVLVNKDAEGTAFLSAYLVWDQAGEAAGIHEYLKLKLPGYMIPAHFVQVPELPLTVNGKVDTKALQAMNQHGVLGTRYRAPSNDIQRVLADVWQQLLGRDRIGIDDHFFQIGGTSLSGVKMVALLSDRYTMSINDVFSYPTIAELSAHVIEKQGYFLDMIETMKHSAVTPQSKEINRGANQKLLESYRNRIVLQEQPDLTQQKQYEHILLTGATGFLGAHLVHELLGRTGAHLTLLIRGGSDGEARQHLTDRLQYYFEDLQGSLGDWSRVTVVAGDLTKPDLGLSRELYDDLALGVDCIIHCASLTRHYGTEEEFQSINVGGTRAVLAFAHQSRPKDVHYLSSMSIATGSKIKILDEFTADIELLDENINNHFLRSKAEAEEWIRKEIGNGLSCTIYRLNSLNNNTRTGKFMFNKESNAFYAFVQGLNGLGIYPDLQEPVLDLTGVDQAANAIVTLFDRPALHNQHHHIFNPNRISWGQFGEEIRSRNSEVRLIPFASFIGMLEEKFKDPATRHSVMNVVLNLFLLRNTEWLSYLRVCERTERDLNRLGFRWTPIHADQIDCYTEPLS
ncbi:amino acid adenylation domain-containing protein [Paenibacillus sp. S-38]|uniref:non-ribosomal peptide synthetase family protein n=1 Tax=Paenibacillus sp. S-38 TaxID=3416710 RepID=UPI003CEFB942